MVFAHPSDMARFARVVALETPHHITQRGNDRRLVFAEPVDYSVYLQLLHHYARLHRLRLLGYCLMPNHVHLVAAPGRPESLGRTMKAVHGRYAAYSNAQQAACGHVWQGRFYSCPMDTAHLWAALRYVERNPVRAGLCRVAAEFPWSSAAVHCGVNPYREWLDLEVWQQQWTCHSWAEHLMGSALEMEEAVRRNTHSGRPLGGVEFVERLERSLGRRLAPQRGGRPSRRAEEESRQMVIGAPA